MTTTNWSVTFGTVTPPPAPPAGTKLWLDWASELKPFLPDCPEFTIMFALQRATTIYYRETRAWRVENVALGSTVAGQRNYTVASPPDDLEMIGLPQAWIGGIEVQEMWPAQASEAPPADAASFDMEIGVSGPASFRIVPAPTVSGQAIVATVAYTIDETATGLPYEQWRQHREGINALALAYLRSQDGKTWTNHVLAAAEDAKARTLMLQHSSQAGPVSAAPKLRVRGYI